jgi:hypothetical protein
LRYSWVLYRDNEGKTQQPGNGIIDPLVNPFAYTDWIKQNRPFTDHRNEQLLELFNKDIETVRRIKPINKGKYVAFVAIRWGFASIVNDRLVQTEKWKNRSSYDDYGQPF